MKRLLAYLILPPHVSAFERSHLKRMNGVALWFYLAHVPLMPLVAWLCGTGPLKAMFLTLGFALGPMLATATFANPRHVSLVHGFTAMGMGGLLVHFGQGSMQIEMHFYFFVLIALLSVFGNPGVILVAAPTVALHHLALFVLLPASVFNYEASVWSVAVHAIFVVLESVAACFVARSFFDNVIGLERRVDARTKELRLLLDSTAQGFLSLRPDGTLADARSAWVDRHLPGEASFAARLRRHDPAQAEWFELSWLNVSSGVLPLEVALAQLPQRFALGTQTIAASYTPVGDAIMVVLSDITDTVARERSEASQRDMHAAFERMARDPRGFRAFIDEGSALVATIVCENDAQTLKRDVHTLKGNAGAFGLSSVVSLCSRAEDEIAEEGTLCELTRAAMKHGWGELHDRVAPLLSGFDLKEIGVSFDEYDALLAAIEQQRSPRAVAEIVRSWSRERAELRLRRLANQAQALAQRLGKGAIEVAVEACEVRLDAAVFSDFWGTLIHVVRNAVDHGLEAPSEREESGKPTSGRLTLGCEVRGDALTVSIHDDGRGIDWTRLAARARERGLPISTEADLIEALFTDGVSTAATITDISGRGVGLGAARSACRALGGEVHVASAHSQGTELVFSWPLARVAHAMTDANITEAA